MNLFGSFFKEVGSFFKEGIIKSTFNYSKATSINVNKLYFVILLYSLI